jgi:hypothetical protein
LRIKINNLTYSKSNPFIKINLCSEDNIICSKEIKGKTKEDLKVEFDWLLKEKEYNSLLKDRIEIFLLRTYRVKGDKIKGGAQITLKNLRENDFAGGNTKLTMSNEKDGNNVQYIDIEINIRSPIVVKQFEKDYQDVMEITKIYKRFYIDKDNYNEQSKNSGKITHSIMEFMNNLNKNSSVVNPKIEGQKIGKNQNNENTQIINNENKNKNIRNNPNKIDKINEIKTINSIDNKQKVDKSLFKEEELKDVDILDNLNSIKVLNDRLGKLNKIISKIDGRTPKELLQKKVKINVKLNSLKEQMNSGEIEPKDYLELMEYQLKHDVLLCRYLKQENEMEKAKNVFSRINLLKEEINELKAYIKK